MTIRSLVLLGFVFFLSGCAHHLYRVYDYDTGTAELGFGTIYVESVGDDRKISERPEITEFREPYMFRIVFLTTDEPGQPIEVNILNLDSIGDVSRTFFTNIRQVTQPNVRTRDPSSQPSTGHTSVIADVITGHQPLTLIIEVTYRGRTEAVTIDLIPRYREEMRGGIRDLLNSV